MEIASTGAINGGPPPSLSTPNGTSIDTNVVIDHLRSLIESTLGASQSDLEAPGSLLSKAKKAETIQRCQRFASEAQVALYVQKDLVSTEKSNGTNGSIGMESHLFSSNTTNSRNSRHVKPIHLYPCV